MNRRKAFKASMVRLVFLFHGLISIFAAVYTTQVSEYWFIGVAAVISMLEMILTYRLNEKGEWKWFVPSAFIYLTMVTPVVWILELAMLRFRLSLRERLGTSRCVVVLADYACFNELNLTRPDGNEIVTDLEMEVYNLSSNWSTTIQQTLMLVLIMGRWLLPKGQLTRDQLSQLLLVYIGMAADMLEFSSETLRLERLACEPDVFHAILAVWSWSLSQFTLGLTATKARKRRVVARLVRTEEEELSKRRYRYSKRVSVYLCGTELWALMISVLIQDGPYLVVRLYLIFGLGIFDQSTIFFTCKNALLLVLQFYRLSVVMKEANRAHAKSVRARVMAKPTPAAGGAGEATDGESGGGEFNGSALAVISGSEAVPNGQALPASHGASSDGSDSDDCAGSGQLVIHIPDSSDVLVLPPNGTAGDWQVGGLGAGTVPPEGLGASRGLNGGPLAGEHVADLPSHHTVTFALDGD